MAAKGNRRSRPTATALSSEWSCSTLCELTSCLCSGALHPASFLVCPFATCQFCVPLMIRRGLPHCHNASLVKGTLCILWSGATLCELAGGGMCAVLLGNL
jgi:hypothetical protein